MAECRAKYVERRTKTHTWTLTNAIIITLLFISNMKTFRFICIMLVLCAMTLRGFSYTNNQIVTFNGLHYKVVSAAEHTLAFIGTDGTKAGTLTLPATVNDGKDVTFKVTTLSYNPGYLCTEVTALKLPGTIERIEDYCIAWAHLNTMNIPASVTYIADCAFANLGHAPRFNVETGNTHFENDAKGALFTKGCTALYSIPSNISLESGGIYRVDSRVKTIHRAAFLNVNGLKKVVLPKNLFSISYGFFTISPTESLEAFDIAPGGNTKFKVIDGVLFEDKKLAVYPRGKTTQHYTVPKGIKTVEHYAISDNSHLLSIDFNEVTTLKSSAVYNAKVITTITIPKNIKKYNLASQEGMAEGCFESCPNVTSYNVGGNPNFVSLDGVLYSTDESTLYFYPANRAGNTYNISTNVTKIADRAFQNAKNITQVYIPAAVLSIGSETFRGMENLTKVTFDPNSKVNSIQALAFRGCGKLKEVTLPKELGYLAAVFYECGALEVINVPDNSKLYAIAAFAFATNRKLKAFNFMGSSKLQTIGTNVFANLTLLKEIKIPQTVKTISANAFIGCSSLRTVTFHPDALIVKIGEGAFANCGITSINIPKNVQTIEREAFMNCQALTKIHVTKATTNISPEAFKECSKLTEINVDRDNVKYASVDGYLLSKDKEELRIFPPGKANDHFTLLPPSITKIGEYAFYHCSKLKNVTIPNKVKRIGKRAFGLCENLNTITFLCDEMILPSDIAQGGNDAAFDADEPGKKKMGKIDIYVRTSQFGAYQGVNFYKKFRSINHSINVGTEEYIAVSDNTAAMLSTTSTDFTFVLPTEFTFGSKKYRVSLIGDFAFEHAAPDLKEVVVRKNVEYIGAKAFVRPGNPLKAVFFLETNASKSMLSTTRFALDETGKDYSEFADGTAIYVKKSAVDAYRNAWTKYTYNDVTQMMEKSPFDFTQLIDYRIKDVKITKKYATFAREFDVDFGDCISENGSRVAAFVAGKKVEWGKPDYGNATYRIRMTSIDKNGGDAGSYAYIPAETGVLLKVIDNNVATNNAFYYTIGEKDNVNFTVNSNVMKGVTGKNTTLLPLKPASYYVMQGGTFRQVKMPITKFPVHKAYMKINKPAGAKLALQFDDDDETFDIDEETTTGIKDVATDGAETTDDAYYNLNGQRVDNPQKGIFIHRGKKVILK